jgi:hypothetical protein
LESVSEILGENWLDGPLELLGDWVFAKACKACSAKMPDMVLGDIPKLGFAVFPCPLLTKVAIVMMPLIDCLKDFLSRKDDAACLNQLSILIFLKPSQHCTWCRVTWSPDLVNSILMNVLVPSLVVATKE